MTASLIPRLEARGVSSLRMAALGEACGLSCVTPDQVDCGPSPVILLTGAVSSLAEDHCWALPRCAWIETGDVNVPVVAHAVNRARAFDLYCSLATASSADFPLAARMVGAIAQRRNVSEERGQDMELALHEAVSNALVHGNLGVASMRDLSISALDSYSQCICDGLANPELAGRRLEVTAVFDSAGVVIDVIDEGAGYTSPDLETPGACGRGLELIAGIADHSEVCDGGRRISMRFHL